jgi:nucleolar MIF4G domain-containing protein 1
MATILSEIEGLYRTHPRANVTSTLTTLLLSILSAEKSLLETFVILHAGFVAALYRIMGTDFCAYLVQNLVEEFEKVHHQFGKESTNLVGFLSELYNFGVVGAGLIYDLIRLFLENLSEVDTELLLKIVQS